MNTIPLFRPCSNELIPEDLPAKHDVRKRCIPACDVIQHAAPPSIKIVARPRPVQYSTMQAYNAISPTQLLNCVSLAPDEPAPAVLRILLLGRALAIEVAAGAERQPAEEARQELALRRPRRGRMQARRVVLRVLCATSAV
jgi:hypothetical protein